jgi:hypothetical protein
MIIAPASGATGAFAALRADGSVVTWGAPYGGDSSAVAAALDGTIDVTQVFSTGSLCRAARRWLGGDLGRPLWRRQQRRGAKLDGTIDVTQVFSTEYAFAALRADGSVVTWGCLILGAATAAPWPRARWHDRRDAGGFDEAMPLPRCAPMARW